MRNPLPTALAIPLLALASVAYAAPSSSPAPKATTGSARNLDLRPPNFFSPQWQKRLEGPTVDHSLDVPSMEYVVVTPGSEGPNTTVSPAGLGSVYWALMHPMQGWRVLMPVQPGDEFNTDHELAMAMRDPMSDCPGFRGTPNVRPVCP